jgi:hypothetical protein
MMFCCRKVRRSAVPCLQDLLLLLQKVVVLNKMGSATMRYRRTPRKVLQNIASFCLAMDPVKFTDLDVVSSIQHVLWLQISVQDTLLVAVAQVLVICLNVLLAPPLQA